MTIESAWQFDAAVAASFGDHARRHIPNYDRVIDKAVAVCQRLLNPESDIIDVGCATGETLRRLHAAGFNNLTGVDSSIDMLSLCDAPARLIHSDNLPSGPYHAVICNWTLHFIKDKLSYLQDIYQQLSSGGLLFLTDKTSKDALSLHFYHEFKRNQGVGEQEIAIKAKRLETVMHLDPPIWYLETLVKLGFGPVQIVDADWCFTSFICQKPV